MNGQKVEGLVEKKVMEEGEVVEWMVLLDRATGVLPTSLPSLLATKLRRYEGHQRTLSKFFEGCRMIHSDAIHRIE